MGRIGRKGLASIWAIAGLTLAVVAPCAHAAVIFSNVADTTTTAPGHGAFTSFGILPSVSGSNVAFSWKLQRRARHLHR